MQIGPHTVANRLFVAPMAGVTDRPFRMLCRRLGAGYAVSEMVTSQPALRHSRKTQRRLDHRGEAAPVAVQIAGTDPAQMAEAARLNIDHGADVIDINMGCPAKKVCNVWAGSALMRDEPLALRIIEAVVAACTPRGVPVTLKMRTGWAAEARNAPRLAQAAEAAGIAMLTVHGRTRDQGYRGRAEHDTVAAIKSRLRIPVVSNGDIDTPERAREVLQATGADALMIGRAAQGRPWLFREIAHFLATGRTLPPPTVPEAAAWLLAHLDDHHDFHGGASGVRSARKHLGWALKALPGGEDFRQVLNLIEDGDAQRRAVETFFAELAERLPRWPAPQPLPVREPTDNAGDAEDDGCAVPGESPRATGRGAAALPRSAPLPPARAPDRVPCIAA